MAVTQWMDIVLIVKLERLVPFPPFLNTHNTALMETSRLDGDNHASPYARLSLLALPETLDDCVLRLVSNTMPYSCPDSS